MSILIKGGIVVSDHQSQSIDVRIEDSRIVELGKHLPVLDSEMLDASSCYILPGFIDGHTHLELNNGPGTDQVIDGFLSGTKAAISGGTTTVLDMATPTKGQSLKDCLTHWKQISEGLSHCDFSYHMAIIEWNASIQAEITTMIHEGISSFKMYMAYLNLMSQDHELMEALSTIHKQGGNLVVHCENEEFIRECITTLARNHQLDMSYYPKSRPVIAEAEAVNRLLSIAELIDAPIGIVHISSKRAMDYVQQARDRGLVVYAETCPHYLFLDEEVYERDNAYQYVCAPPIRSLSDKTAILQALKKGWIDTISTDQCAFSDAIKSKNIHDFRSTPGGLPGIEHRAQLIYTYAVRAGLITIEDMVALLSGNIAKQFQLYPRKGSIQVGADADLVIWDPTVERRIRASDQVMQVEYNPYEGILVYGQARYVYLRGKLVSTRGEVQQEASGKFLSRHVYPDIS